MSSQILFRTEAQNKLIEGLNILADAVGTTLGPRGMNCAIDKGYMHTVVHDGITVARSIDLKDPYVNLGVKIAREAAQKTVDQVGDGTSVTTILVQAIVNEAIKITSSGTNAMSLRRELEGGVKKLIEKLNTLGTPIENLKQKINIATISSEDPELGKMVAETIHKIGIDGVITVEESKMPDTVIEMQEGMQIDKGYTHPFMVTEPERQIAVLEDVHILITDIPLSNLIDIGKFLENEVLGKGVNKMVFISPEIGGDFLTALLGAKVNGKFLGLSVRAPMVGSHQTEALQDLCSLTGAKLVSKDGGHKFDEIDLTWCGKVKRIVSTKFNSTITGGDGHKDDILRRIQIIKEQMKDDTLSEFDREKLRERLGKLTDGIAVIKVGGETEVEMKERKERVIDAVAATQAATKYGIVPGGEIIYLIISEVLDKTILGEKILFDALSRPFKKLVENAGFDGGQMLSEFGHNKGKGLDVTDGVWKDMIKEGIIDPLSVSTTAIKTAVSVAIQLLTTGCAIVPDKEDETK